MPCPADFYGPECKEQCRCMHGGSCDPVSGKCNCTSGWKGPLYELGILITLFYILDFEWQICGFLPDVKFLVLLEHTERNALAIASVRIMARVKVERDNVTAKRDGGWVKQNTFICTSHITDTACAYVKWGYFLS